MRVFVKVLKTTALRTLREPANVVFMIAFAPTFMLIMGLIFGNGPKKEFGGQGFLDANVTAFPGIVIAIAAVIILPVDLVTQRETGVLRRFRATPLRPAVYMSADLTVRVALSLLSIACLYAVAIVGFGVGADAVRAVNVLLATALGLCAFMALLLVGGALALPGRGAGDRQHPRLPPHFPLRRGGSAFPAPGGCGRGCEIFPAHAADLSDEGSVGRRGVDPTLGVRSLADRNGRAVRGSGGAVFPLGEMTETSDRGSGNRCPCHWLLPATWPAWRPAPQASTCGWPPGSCG